MAPENTTNKPPQLLDIGTGVSVNLDVKRQEAREQAITDLRQRSEKAAIIIAGLKASQFVSMANLEKIEFTW